MPNSRAIDVGEPITEVGESTRQTPDQIAEAVRAFIRQYPQAAVLEDGKVAFELGSAQHNVTSDHGRCTLQLWSNERNLVRTLVAVSERNTSLRLESQRFGQTQTKLLELVSQPQPKTRLMREPGRKHYMRLLERVLAREFTEWKPEAFRAAMDLERSFGPAYARGSVVKGNEGWAVIGVGMDESQTTIDGVLTLGILWLHHCRERGDGRRVFKGLRVVVPSGCSLVTLMRMRWLNTAAGQWELYELNEDTEELVRRDLDDQGNLRTKLLHLVDSEAARERFQVAIEHVMGLVPDGQQHRVEQRLRSTAELAFLLHGLEFARARISLASVSFAHTLEITVGSGPSQTVLTPATKRELSEHIAELFRRRDPRVTLAARSLRSAPPSRSIGVFTGKAAHARAIHNASPAAGINRLEQRERMLAAQQDPLFRASPERWLESVLRENLAPLTRSLGPTPGVAHALRSRFANDLDPDTRGNRADPAQDAPESDWGLPKSARLDTERIIPRFDPRFVYTQVPAIAGASDRGMLDLLGVTADGRLAVIELKAADDLQLALQGLDYWIRVQHHHAQMVDPKTGLPGSLNDLQRHGYFREVELSPLPPRLYLVAPALHIHPVTETVLHYLSPRVEWTLLALDERWRQEVRVVWRKSGGRRPS